MYGERPRFSLPRPSTAVRGLLIANVAVFVLTAAIGRNLGGRALDEWLAVGWDELWEGYGLGLLRLFSYQFAHSYTDIRHIVFNMLGLYLFGVFVESEVGKRGLLRLYLSAGLAGAALQILLGFAFGVPMLVIGASGAVYGIAVYAACMAPRLEVLWTIQLRWLVGLMVLVGAYDTLLALRGDLGPGGGVAHGAHLGGALFGFVAFKQLRHWYVRADERPHPLVAKLIRWRDARRARDRAQLRAELDRLLDKVHRDGMGALTRDERRTLERASRELHRR
jgi:membrane associated rhomboid family serine protease